jgi:predicted AAA+ superfamily ATPase
MNITRELRQWIAKDLASKIVMIGGPRQVGKTTLAKSFISEAGQYLTWDDLSDRKKIRLHDIDTSISTVVLDEVHKYARWRTLLKGLFDKYHERLKIIVTGSARLDLFRKGGDSLFGRFFYFRLHPLTVMEVKKNFPKRDAVRDLLSFGGFPEPFVKKDPTFLRRWQRERCNRVVNQDVSDLSLVKELSLMEVLVDMLPARIGSLLSIKGIQEDLEVSPNTVSKWISILEQVYYCYRIFPYGSKKTRAIKKTPKLYLWDWSEIQDHGARWENFVASHLLKYCHFREDTEGVEMELRFLRDIDGREVDFVVIQDGKPIFAVECKTGEKGISKNLLYFRDRTPIPKFYQVHCGTDSRADGSIEVLPFVEFCKKENIP